MIHKAMVNLKGMETKSTLSSVSKDHETIASVCMLRDVEPVTLSVFESLLSFISGPKSKPSGWSLVTKIMQTKRVACEDEKEKKKKKEFAEVDEALNPFIGTRQANVSPSVQILHITSLRSWNHAFKIRKDLSSAYLGNWSKQESHFSTS